MFSTVLPIFLLILTGYIFAKKEKVSQDAEQLINSYVLNIALPALLFLAIAKADVSELTKWGFLFSTLAGIIVAYICGLVFASLLKIKAPNSSILAMASSYGTTGYMGIPLVIIAFGSISAVPAALATILHNIPAIMAVIITYGIMGQSLENKMSKFKIIKSAFLTTLKNPLTLAVLAGMFFSVLKIELPEVLINFSNFLGMAAGPTALFALGLGLAKLKITEHLEVNKLLKIFPFVFIKILIQPLVTFFLAFYIFKMSLDDVYFKTAIIMSALPIGAGVYVFASKYNYYKDESSIAIILSLTITLGSLSYLLNLFN